MYKTIKTKNMSTTTLTNLLEYLYGALTPSNMRWVGEHLIEYAEKKEALEPYTIEELLERAEKGRQEIVDGQYKTNEEVFKQLLNEA